MALINIQTKLKDLKYGKDRPFGGSSNEPYIQKDFVTSAGLTPLLRNDFILRGGAFSLKDAAEDAVRYTKFFFDLKSPKGLLFISKQNLLAKQNPLTPGSPGRVYNPLNTIVQVASLPLGERLMGVGSSLRLKESEKYEYITRNTNNDESNRLQLLYLNKIIGINKPSTDYGIVSDNNVILKYINGPTGAIGGSTIIKRSVYSLSSRKDWEDMYPYVLTLNQSEMYSLKYDSSDGLKVYGRFPIDRIYDFRKILFQSASYQTQKEQIVYSDYENFNRIKTFGLGDPGKRGIKRNSYNSNFEGTSDEITLHPLYTSNSVDDNVANKDMIKFYIGVVDNDDPSQYTWIHFRAFLDSFSDKFSKEVNSVKYAGRGEKFYTQGGFERNINLSFKIHAQSRQELLPMYTKLNYLASTIAPDYNNAGFMRGTLIKLTVGDYLKDTYGILSSIDVNLMEGPWDIGRNSDGTIDKNGKQLPHLVSVDGFSFTPIHRFLPRTITPDDIKNNRIPSPFIGIK